MTARPHLGRGTLRARLDEREELRELVEAVHSRESRTLVIQGDHGVGKTVSLDYVTRRASNSRIARAAVVRSRDGADVRWPASAVVAHLDHSERATSRAHVSFATVPTPKEDAHGSSNANPRS